MTKFAKDGKTVVRESCFYKAQFDSHSRPYCCDSTKTNEDGIRLGFKVLTDQYRNNYRPLGFRIGKFNEQK